MFDKTEKDTTITDTYAAFDLGQRTIQTGLKSQDGEIVND
jgi:hypothetical protein